MVESHEAIANNMEATVLLTLQRLKNPVKGSLGLCTRADQQQKGMWTLLNDLGLGFRVRGKG